MTKKLQVKMFGGFSASYGNEMLTFGRQRDSKFRQLFQILMTRPGQGFDKSDITMSLYGQDEVEDANASLNNTIFRLRKYLESSQLPSGDYLILEEGVLRFGGGIEVESDVWDFERMALEFENEQNRRIREDLCKRACELYQGEFLPSLSNEQWVIEKSQNYKKVYFIMLKYLLRCLKEDGDYGSIRKVSAHAAILYPCEGWEIWCIESLVGLGFYREAEEAYRKTAAYIQETGRFLSKQQQKQLHEIGVRIRRPEETEEDIRKYLMESTSEPGAYACTLPGFLDCFHMLKRVSVRGGSDFSLILCTILDAAGRPTNNRKYCERQGKILCASFRSYLRRGDVYAKYSAGQYLLLCMGVGRKNVPEIGARIDMDYRKRCGGRGGISYRILDGRNV